MLILPLIDLLTLLGTCLLAVGIGLKVVDIGTRWHGSILGFSSLDFVLMTGVCWGFALVLAARSWVKLNEPALMALRREQMAAEARRQASAYDLERELGGNSLTSRGSERAAPDEVAGEPVPQAVRVERS